MLCAVLGSTYVYVLTRVSLLIIKQNYMLYIYMCYIYTYIYIIYLYYKLQIKNVSNLYDFYRYF